VKNVNELREVLGRIMLQRSLDDVGEDVPPIDWQLLPIDGQYPRYLSDKDRDPDGGIDLDERDPALAAMRRELGEIKAPIIASMLDAELEESEDKIVLFAHHRSVLARLTTSLIHYGVSYIDGDTTDAEREEAVDRFQNDPSQRVFVGQTHACKEVITLTAANRAVQVEPDWTANVNVQAAHRLRRIGQKRHVAFQMVSLEGSIDQRIVRQNLRETQMEAEVFNVQE
jgi:SWI/SNF-related matrix-associated actin-dependent regulator 1 of chromatin subfamily A